MSKRGNKEGSIYRKGGKWCGQVTVGWIDGRQKRRTVYGNTRESVVAQVDELKRLAAKGEIDKTGLTLEGWLRKWTAMVRSQVGASTYIRYELDLSYLQRVKLPSVPLGRLTGLQVASIGVDLAASGLTPNQQHKALQRLKQALRAACDLGVLESDPGLRITLPRVSRKEMVPLTPAQVQTLLEKAQGDPYYHFYLLAVDTGARLGELLALDWSDIDLSTGVVKIRRALYERGGQQEIRETKTAGSRRVVHVTPLTCQVLREVATRSRGPHVVEGEDGGYVWRSPLRRKSWVPLLRRAGLPLRTRLHDLRHTCATLLLSQRLPLKAVQERLGHSRPETTLGIYSHTLPGQQEAVVDVMQGILGPSSSPVAAR